MGDVTQFHIDDVSAICRVPISIDRRDDILINGLGMSKISTGNPIKLPQYAALADCEDQLTSIEINQYALKDIIHVQGVRSEEHTSELQSLMRIPYAVFCLKKKINTRILLSSNSLYLYPIVHLLQITYLFIYPIYTLIIFTA